MMKSTVRYEEEASDPTAVWRIVTVANYKADMVRQQRGDFQKSFNGLKESMNRVEALLQLVHSQVQTLEQIMGRGVSHLRPSEKTRMIEDLTQPAELEMEMARSTENLWQISLNGTQGIQLMSTTEGNFKFPSTYPSVVVTGWGEDPLPQAFVASPTLNKLDPNSEPLVVALDSPELVGGEPLVGAVVQKKETTMKSFTPGACKYCGYKWVLGHKCKQNQQVNLMAGDVSDEAQFDLAQLYVVERADKRLRCTGLFWKLPPWPDFCAMGCDSVSQHCGYEVIENFYSVKQYNHSVLDYTDKFEEQIEQTIVKANFCTVDCHNVDRKFRQKLEMTEDEAHFHMKQGTFLSNLEAQMLPKSHHCYFIRLMLEYFKFSSLDADESSACKYVILSKNARMESLLQFGHLHFLFPEIFKDLNKGVMLGDDVIVQRDLSFLGNLNMGDKVNGTVEFWGVRLDQVRNLLGENITYDSKSCAWMSGVNVTNLDKWRKHDVTEDYLLLLKKFKTKDTELFKENVALCSNANAEKGTTGGNDNQNQTDLFNWEDAAEISAEKLREYGCKHSNTGAEVSKDKYGYYQKKKYRRDFLVKFKQKLHANLSKCVFAASHVEYLGLEMNWDANPSIILDIKIRLGVSLPIQVKDIGFTGVLHLIFRPRVNELPCFGAVCFSLRQKKRLDFTLWIIGGEISVIPGISDALEDTIKNAIEDSITWPVRKVIPIIPGDYSDLELKSVGTMEVNLVQARDLTNKDVIGKSDPFAILYVRPLTDKTKRSKTINNGLNPIWNAHFEFIVEDADTQSTTVKIYDDDDGIQELKLQLEVFFPCVVLRLAQSKYGASFQQQEVALEALVDFYRQNEFMAEMYATMDCDLQCSNVFGDIANLISKSAFPVNSPLSALNVLALDGLVVVVQAIAERTDNAPKLHEQTSPEISEYFPFWRLKCENNDDPDQWVRYVHQKKGIKRKLMVGVEHFNRDKKKGFEYLQGVQLLSEKLDPHSSALFFRYIPGLDKILLGTTLVIMKIQRILEAFSERCYEQSPHMFVNKDVALVLSYSVIMLNTDQKNVRVKKEMIEEDIKNGLVSFDLRQREITDFFQQCYKWDVLTARSIGAAGPDNQSPNILLDDTLLVEMDKNLFTAVKIQWFNGSICYLKKLLGGMQILSKEYSQSFILRLSNLSFLISILEDKYVVEGKVMSEPEITEELKKCWNSEDNASSSFRVIAIDGGDAIWPQWWEINVPDYSSTRARLIVVDYLLLVLITQLILKLSL